MSALETLKASELWKLIPPEQIPMMEKFIQALCEASNQAVDACIELVEKWGSVKQLDQTSDFKLLLEYMEKNKEDIA